MSHLILLSQTVIYFLSRLTRLYLFPVFVPLSLSLSFSSSLSPEPTIYCSSNFSIFFYLPKCLILSQFLTLLYYPFLSFLTYLSPGDFSLWLISHQVTSMIAHKIIDKCIPSQKLSHTCTLLTNTLLHKFSHESSHNPLPSENPHKDSHKSLL